MAGSHAEIFGLLRTEILDTVVNSRSSIDDAFESLGEEDIRRHFHSMLEHMQKYIASPSPALLQASVSKWTALFLGMGLSPRSVLRSVVSLGDLSVQVARQRLEPGPDTNLYIREVVRLNFNAAREVVSIFNDELVAQSA
jgi:hypothetical protein